MTGTEFNPRLRFPPASRDSKFVQPAEFLKLLLSRREMIRSDGPGGKVRGLIDLRTGKKFLIEQEKLQQAL